MSISNQDIALSLERIERRISFIGYLAIFLVAWGVAIYMEIAIPRGWNVSEGVGSWASDGVFLALAYLLSWRFRRIGFKLSGSAE
jgi:hypothetical protein